MTQKREQLLQRCLACHFLAGESGWIDIPYALRAYLRSNREYVVFVEEDAKAKVIMYRFTSNN